MKYKYIKECKPILINIRTRLEYIQAKENIQEYVYNSLVEKMAICCEKSRIAKCKNCGAEHHKETTYCNQRLCPVCAKRKSLKYVAVLSDIFMNLMKRHYVCMLTFTIPDSDNLKENMDNLEKSWRYMVHDCKFTRFGFKKLIAGGIRSFETKLGENSKKWHSHYHCIIIKSKFCKDFEILKAYWKHATKYITGKEGSIDIRSIKLRNDRTTTQINNYESLIKAINETVKYITKFNFSDYSDKQVIELVNETYKKRFTNGFGILSRYQKDFAKADEMNEDEAVKMICRNCKCTEFDIEEVLTDSIPEDILEFEREI